MTQTKEFITHVIFQTSWEEEFLCPSEITTLLTSFYRTLDLPVAELHINGIRQCVIGEGLVSFTQHVFEIYPCCSMK